jgi:hypothetical protein
MSLLDEAMETCVFVSKQIAPDGYGGYKTVWVDGAEFNAAIVFDTSMQARIAEVQGVVDLYTITVPRSVPIEDKDVFRRLSDGKVFRATSDGEDNKTPDSAALDMRQVTAKEWVLTS